MTTEAKQIHGVFRKVKTTGLWTINPRRNKNVNGYGEANSPQQVENIAAIMQCWEGLISNKILPTATALRFTSHRITGSKEAT